MTAVMVSSLILIVREQKRLFFLFGPYVKYVGAIYM